ncbi:hypothetical protein U472_10795 [Orenia metallireducens]|uniref:ATPase AAA-type core domain-containing protein n=1 Tax=Orenia metallireducens TaxID=1413210 RepID=A0A1C0A962_9FIRM|nr:hypothetical protein U472_10795 [Orenia metallireducens]
MQDNNEKKEKIKFEKIFEYHSKAAKNIDFFNFDWRDLSSGEKALLNIYSRFYSLVDHNLEDNLIILIDEGELYLHPQWQKRFIYDLIEILPEIYPNKYIHIILTSHSPFVASDLPSSNIIFLKKDEKGRCKVVDGLEENNRTFGANIHTLFSDSFFMKDGLMGDFAKHKINELIKLLLGDTKKIKEKKDYIQSSINIIGEPVIRTKLLNMLKEKLEVDLISLDERIANLERELDELKRKKAND